MARLLVCTRCGRSEPEVAFYPKRYQCKPCVVAAQKVRYQNQRANGWRQPTRSSEQVRIDNLRRYGLTVDDYDRLLAEQGGACAICGVDRPEIRRKTDRHFHVDHCHETGVVRGLLCNRCNRGLGMLGDDNLNKAILYLEKAYSQQGEPRWRES